MTTKITEKNISNIANFGVQWQSVITADGSTATTAVAGQGYFIDTTSATHTINLPASATSGDTIAIKDYAGTFGTNALTIGRNGNNIQGVANNSEIITNKASLVLVYIDATKGWLYTNESNVADLQIALYVTATGGTVTTSGDYKIHSFTGDGCFVVSCGGNPAGSDSVDYLVVAGGGSGGVGNANDGGGGGGAGGFRESSGAASGGYTASPLGNCVSALPVSATTYPITVGGGGSATVTNCTPGNKGSNSVFSTITSAGGGGGDANGPQVPFGTVKDGGSGGGGHQNAGGDGNTPPVSPPQGNNGGPSGDPAGAGGGGASTAGSANPGSNNSGGPGGNGATTSISTSPTAYAGGGGGANSPGRAAPVGPAGSGGTGGGGPSTGPGGTAGSANTGGGGGAGSSSNSGAGGKGIVILRYKYQN